MVQLSQPVWPEAVGDVGAYADDVPLSLVSPDRGPFAAADPFLLLPTDFPAHYQSWVVN